MEQKKEYYVLISYSRRDYVDENKVELAGNIISHRFVRFKV